MTGIPGNATAARLMSTGSTGQKFPMPVKRLYSLFTYYELDVNRMQEAAAYLEENMISKASARPVPR